MAEAPSPYIDNHITAQDGSPATEDDLLIYGLYKDGPIRHAHTNRTSLPNVRLATKPSKPEIIPEPGTMPLASRITREASTPAPPSPQMQSSDGPSRDVPPPSPYVGPLPPPVARAPSRAPSKEVLLPPNTTAAATQIVRKEDEQHRQMQPLTEATQRSSRAASPGLRSVSSSVGSKLSREVVLPPDTTSMATRIIREEDEADTSREYGTMTSQKSEVINAPTLKHDRMASRPTLESLAQTIALTEARQNAGATTAHDHAPRKPERFTPVKGPWTKDRDSQPPQLHYTHHDPVSGMTLVLLALFVPPLAVYLALHPHHPFWWWHLGLSAGLTLLLWVPGAVHALVVVALLPPRHASRRQHQQQQQQQQHGRNVDAHPSPHPVGAAQGKEGTRRAAQEKLAARAGRDMALVLEEAGRALEEGGRVDARAGSEEVLRAARRYRRAVREVRELDRAGLGAVRLGTAIG